MYPDESFVVAEYSDWKKLMTLLENIKIFLSQEDIDDLNGWITFIESQVEENLYSEEDIEHADDWEDEEDD